MLKRKAYILLLIGLGFACEDILEEVDISSQTVTVFAPVEGSVVNTNAVQFNWNRVEEATSYRFQLADPNFENTRQLLIDSILPLDSLGNVNTSINQTLLNGNYAWRIKALNSNFETSYTTANFQVDGDEDIDIVAPNTPVLVAPANGTTQDETEVSFSWTREDVPGTAERDSIYFYEEETLTTLISKDIGANKSYAATVTSGTYYWVVQAFDAAGNESAASETFNFTVN
ncbi:hypothetical protein [uncultured Croceitalea sp.]|uniref:hypothetical protein n=1 Tax=uncultured Croceitalea sp. TaxID=1798908 RepID=UPI003305D8DB